MKQQSPTRSITLVLASALLTSLALMHGTGTAFGGDFIIEDEIAAFQKAETSEDPSLFFDLATTARSERIRIQAVDRYVSSLPVAFSESFIDHNRKKSKA